MRIEDLWLEAATSRPADGDGRGPEDEFEKIRAGFESVAKLQPPSSEGGGPGGAAFGDTFSDLVRSVVRDYVEKDLEGVIRSAVSSEIRAQRGSGDD